MFEVTGLRELIADLTNAEKQSPGEVRKVVQKGALNIKTDWRARWSGHAHAPALSRSVTYDTKETGGGASAEIGPDKGISPGPLGNIYEFGTPRNGPQPGGLPALQAEEPKFLKAIEDMARKLLDG